MPRPEAEIMSDILEVYNGLSPENLSCDGMASNTEIKKRSKVLFTELARLEAELGRKVSDSEAYQYEMKRIEEKLSAE